MNLPLRITGTGRWRLDLFDLAGRLLRVEEGDAPWQGLLRLETSDLPPGTYLVRLTTPSGAFTVASTLLGT